MVLVTQRVSESTVNLSTKLKIRCPSCAKLYEVSCDDIHSETPLFQCISCETRFSFEYPPTDLQNVACFAVSMTATEAPKEEEVAPAAAAQQHLGETYSVEPGTHEMKSCPKCGALNGRRAKECYSCHVLFERLEGLPKDPSLKAQPSLVRKWKNLVENFENEQLHDEFIRACHELDALRFATLKYEELKAAQGGDPQCDQMIARINSLMMVGLSQKPVATVGKVQAAARPKWQKYMYWGPFGLSAFLILLGMINLGHRNLIGVGVALAFMSAGLMIMIRGKISLSDFVD
ncbi:hypothetical protein ACLWBD_05505 [Bdellovibrio sp. HCB117]|uniref:hypothetical protein n=1 Tax=Bdellovibrio sp. HCB117 TaxID=3394359 RepID=UPI0039B5337B